jgi:hypothetical protein
MAQAGKPVCIYCGRPHPEQINLGSLGIVFLHVECRFNYLQTVDNPKMTVPPPESP